MKHRPQPVVVMSSLTQQGSEVALRCLQEGAIDVIGKPSGSHSAHEDGSLLAHKLRSAAAVDMRRFLNHFKARHEPVAALQPVSVPATVGGSGRTQKLIAIGSSTGGTEALGRIFRMLPEGLPGMLIVQHIPAHFSGAFAARLNQIGRVRVKQSEEGDVIETGTALLAPGDHHMVVKPHGSQWVVSLNRGPRIHYQRPAVDVLFDSMARLDLGSRSLAILLTGMGSDGAAGMLKLREQGARTLAQDRHTCVVYGMPREAVMNGGAMKEVPLDSVPNEMVQFAQQPLRRALEAVS